MELVIFVKYACKCQKEAALRIESFPCNHSIDAVLADFNSTRQRSGKIQNKNCQIMIQIILNVIKTRKTRKSTVFTKSHCLYVIKPCQICYGFAGINLIHNHPPRAPGDLHQKFAPTLGLLHPSFCPGGGHLLG